MITIVIHTLNRSDFLIRLLKYYVDTNYQHWIFIGDSSTGLHAMRTKEAIKTLEGKLKIRYYEYPGVNVAVCANKLSKLISTPYVACVSDGGFLVPSSLEKCIKFLDSHPEYSIAHGVGILFKLKTEGPYGKFYNISKYTALPIVEQETATARLLYQLNNYSVTMYCTYRSDIWRAMWSDVEAIEDMAFASELLPCCLSVIYGKAKHLDCLYLIRQLHSRRYPLPDLYHWITNPNWFPSYQLFCNRLAEELVKYDSIDHSLAQDIVKQGLRSYLYNSLYLKLHEYYPRGISKISISTKILLKRIPGLAQAWRSLKFRLFPKYGMSLPRLLNPRFPYHADFMPIYHLVTSGGKDNFKI